MYNFFNVYDQNVWHCNLCNYLVNIRDPVFQKLIKRDLQITDYCAIIRLYSTADYNKAESPSV